MGADIYIYIYIFIIYIYIYAFSIIGYVILGRPSQYRDLIVAHMAKAKEGETDFFRECYPMNRTGLLFGIFTLTLFSGTAVSHKVQRVFVFVCAQEFVGMNMGGSRTQDTKLHQKDQPYEDSSKLVQGLPA